MNFYDSIKSKSKLWILFKDNNTRVYYSLLKYDRQNIDKGIEALIKKFVRGKDFKGKYKKAIIFDNTTKKVLKQFNTHGIEELI